MHNFTAGESRVFFFILNNNKDTKFVKQRSLSNALCLTQYSINYFGLINVCVDNSCKTLNSHDTFYSSYFCILCMNHSCLWNTSARPRSAFTIKRVQMQKCLHVVMSTAHLKHPRYTLDSFCSMNGVTTVASLEVI